MATLIQRTTSNRPKLTDPDAVTDLLDEYRFVPGAHGSISVGVKDGHLSLYGEGGFEPAPWDAIDENTQFAELRHVDKKRFLSELSAFLAEPLVVQTIANEKLRYPFGGAVWIVHPDSSPEDVVGRSLADIAQAALQDEE